MKKKTVIFHYPLIIYGGVEVAIRNLLQRIHTKYDITILFDKEDCDSQMLLELSKYADITSTTDNMEFDLCIYCSMFQYPHPVEAKDYKQWIHGNVNEMNYKPVIRQEVTEYIAVSKECARQWYEATGQKCRVIYNELDIDIETKAKDKVEKIFDNVDLKIITVSRIANQKGFDRLPIIAQEIGKEINYQWVIVGAGHDKQYEKKIKESCANINQIKFIGKKQNPYPYMKQAHILAQLSDAESFGLSPMEAQKLGIPCLITNYKTAKELVTHKKNGLILEFDMSNISDIIKSLKEVSKLKATFEYDGEYKKFEEMIDSSYSKHSEKTIRISPTRAYYDKELDRKVTQSKQFYVTPERYTELSSKGLCRLIKIRKGLQDE